MPLKPDSSAAFNEFLEGMRPKLTPQEFQTLQQTFGAADDRMQFVADAVLMKSDYSRMTQQHNTEFAAKVAKLNEEAARLAEIEQEQARWEQYIKDNTVSAAQHGQIKQELEHLQRFRSATEEKIRALGLDELLTGLDEEDQVPNQDPRQQPPNGQPPNGSPPNPAFDPSRLPGDRYVTKQAFQSQLQEAAVGTVVGHAALLDLDDEFRLLTGKPLPNRQQLVVEALQAGKSVMEYIETKFDMPKLRIAAADAAREAEIEKRVQERLAKQTSQQTLPVPGGLAQGPVLSQTMAAMNAKSTEERSNIPLFGKPGQPGRGAQAATEAFLQRKYKGESVNPWTG